MKSFSVVLTYFEKPERLSQALYCLAQQTYDDFEVVPVFDGPDTQAEFIYRQFVARSGDNRFRTAVIFENGKREHFGNDARYLAMQYCHKDYIVWYGHDCIIDKDYLETHADQIQEDWCVSVVGQAHFTWHDHPQKWLTYREDLPRTDDPAQLRMEGIDLLNFAVPTHVAEKWAWAERLRDRYEADWFTFRDIVANSALEVRINNRVVCGHF